MRKVMVIIMVAMIIFYWVFEAKAGGDLDKYPARFYGSLKAFPPAVNVAGMGNFWAALPNPFSANPAAYSTFPEIDQALYGSGSEISFNAGPDIHLSVIDVLLKMGKGYLRLDYYGFNSGWAETKISLGGMNLENKVEGKCFQFGYGLPVIKDKLFLGLTIIPLYSSDVKFNSPCLDVRAKSRNRGAVRLGGLYSPFRSRKVWLGLVIEHSKNRLQTDLNMLAYQPDLGGFYRIKEKQVEHPSTSLVRSGLSIKPWEGATIGIDWVWGKVDVKGTKDYHVNQVYAGMEQWLNPNLALRAGAADKGFTAGLGLRKEIAGNQLFIDYAFMTEPMGDMKPFWGGGKSHLVSLTFAW